MTAAFAKEMGLPVRYQRVLVDDAWSRSGGIYFASLHVNLTLGTTQTGVHMLDSQNTPMTIDFLPGADLRGRRMRVLQEDTIVAMYMNNRAAEALARGQVNDAYWWVRGAIEQVPRFLSSYNTLGVIYLHHGDLPQADAVFAEVLEREPRNTRAMFNRAQVQTMLGHNDESGVLYRRLAELEPYPPFHFFNLGMAAMQREDYRAARDLFAREVQRAEYYHEFHYWLGVANYRIGDIAQARKHLSLAMENSTSRGDHDLYAAKLAWLKSFQHQ